MKGARKQNGSLYLDTNGSRCPVWMFAWKHVRPDGTRVRKKRQVGTFDQYKTEAAAERAVRRWRLAINSNQVHMFSGITLNDVIEHFRQKELIDKGENGRAYATRDRYESYLSRWITPRRGKEELQGIKTPIVEERLAELKFDPNWRKKRFDTSKRRAATRTKEKIKWKNLAPGSKAKIRDIMCVLFDHAIRWGFTEQNPISGACEGIGSPSEFEAAEYAGHS
jgi:integrase